MTQSSGATKQRKPRQIAVVSGKGGTGKTSVTASLARIAAPVVVADCDVDAANLGLLLPGVDDSTEDFFGGHRAEIDSEACIGCGTCAVHCRFAAVAVGDDLVAAVDRLACEGCGVCDIVCPSEAVRMVPNRAGHWCTREIEEGILVHASLGIAQDNSGKLVAKVRQEAAARAEALGVHTVLIDGPPGVGCPVHATLTGADCALAVTEPTPAGEHDLRRMLELTKHFGCPAAVLVNKADLNPPGARDLDRLAAELGFAVVGQLPFSLEVPRLLARGELPLAVAEIADGLRRAWTALLEMLDERG